MRVGRDGLLVVGMSKMVCDTVGLWYSPQVLYNEIGILTIISSLVSAGSNNLHASDDMPVASCSYHGVAFAHLFDPVPLFVIFHEIYANIHCKVRLLCKRKEFVVLPGWTPNRSKIH